MRKLLLFGIAAALCTIGVSGQVQAFGKHRNCASDCAATYSVSYVPQTVTCYKPVWKTKMVEVEVCKVNYVTKKVPVEYMECVPVWKDVMTTVCKYETKQVPIEYMACVPVWKDVMTTVCKYETKQVPVEYMECVPVWKDVVQKVTTYQSVSSKVVVNVTCCKVVPICVVDPCTGCSYTVCQKQMITTPVEKTVWTCVPTTKDVNVKVCENTYVKKQGFATQCVPVQVQVAAKVCEMTQVKKQGFATQCVPVQVQVPAKVCTMTQVKKQGFVNQCEAVYSKDKVQVQQSYCEWQAVATTVNVPVYTPCVPAPPCGAVYGGPGGGPSMSYVK